MRRGFPVLFPRPWSAIWLACLACLGLQAVPAAQTSAFIPQGFEKVPGNAALSMPVRWHEGLMQILVEQPLVPSALVGKKIKRIQLRRPAFFYEPDYAALSRTFTIQMASTQMSHTKLDSDMEANRQFIAALAANPPSGAPNVTNLTVVAQAIQYNVPATKIRNSYEPVGEDMISLPLATPYTFQGPDLFVDWQTTSQGSLPDKENWVDALALYNPGDVGLVVTLGQGGCGSVSSPGVLPMTLDPGATAPTLGQTLALRLRTAPASAKTFLSISPYFGIPDPKYPTALAMPTVLIGQNGPICRLWASGNTGFGGSTDTWGNHDFSLQIPSDPRLNTLKFTAQAFVEDRKGSNPWRLAASNGVYLIVNSLGLGSRIATVLDFRPFIMVPKDPKFPSGPKKAVAPKSYWPPFLNTMPIMRLSW